MQEVQQSTSQLVSAAVRGAVEGASSLGEGSRDMTTKILDVLSSERGSSLLTLAISVACKSSTDAFCSNLAQAAADSGQPDMMQRLLHFAGECGPASAVLQHLIVLLLVRLRLRRCSNAWFAQHCCY